MTPQLAFSWLTKDGEEQFSGKVDAGIKGTKGTKHTKGNSTYYSSLAAQVTAIEAAYAVYLVAKANAAQGGVENTAIREARRADLVELLRALLNNINAIANGDLEKLMSSRFPLRKTDRTGSRQAIWSFWA